MCIRDSAYVADNQPDPGGGGNFHDISNEIRFNWLTAEMAAQPIYTLAPGYPNYTAVRAANLAALGDGQLMMHWFGHGSKWRWGYSGSVRPLGVLDQNAVSYTHLRAHETVLDLVCRLLLETKKQSY